MRLFGAFLLLLAFGAKNRTLAQIRRLKKPRFLLATFIGLGYWWLYLGRGLFHVRRAGTLSPSALAALELGAAVLGLLGAARPWLFGTDRAALTFSEAEIQFLFPAPATRRTLVQYKLLRSLLFGLVSALISALLLGRALSGHPLFFALGLWLALSALSLHTLGASFARQALLEHGAAGLPRRLPALGAALALSSALALAAWKAKALPPFAPTRAFLWAALGLAEVAPLSWLLAPVRAFTRLAFAPDARTFAEALPLALGLLALHYLWVLRSDVSFEESSLEAAQARSRWLEARQSGVPRLAASKRREPPFRLRSAGRPEVALAWKGLIAAGRTFNLRTFSAVGVSLGASAAVLGSFSGGGARGMLDAVGMFALALWAFAALGGGRFARTDLRRDVAYLDVLRSLPLTGRQIVLGEALGALVPVAAIQWILLAVAAALLRNLPLPSFDFFDRLAAGIALALAGPALTLASLMVQNAAAILAPGWIGTAGERTHGPEALGLNLLLWLGNLVAVAVGVLPAAAAGAIAALALWPWLGALAAPPAALTFAAVLVAEAWLAAALLGRAFERSDPSA